MDVRKSIHLWVIHIPVCIIVFYSLFVLPLWCIPLLIIFGAITTGIFIEGGLHKYFTHQTGRVKHKFWHYFFAIGATLTGAGPIPIWIWSHRVHHKFSDSPRDTHSPKQHGIRNTFFAHWFIWKVDKSANLQSFYGLIYKNDKLIRFLTDNYLKINLTFMAVCFFIHPILLVLYAWSCFMGLIGSGITNTMGHIYGEYKDYPKLNAVMCWTSTAYHGTHHKQPTRVYYNEFLDPVGWILKKFLFKNT